MTELVWPSSTLVPSTKSSPLYTCLCSHPLTLFRVIRCHSLPSTKVKDTSFQSSIVHVGTKFHA